MRNVRHFYVPDALVFIAAVARHRRPIFEQDKWAELLFETMRAVQQIHPIRLLACAILPEHFHWIIRTPDSVTYSQVMHSIKRNFTLNYKPVKHGLLEKPADWPCSSFRLWVEQGYYELGWGYAQPEHIKDMDLE